MIHGMPTQIALAAATPVPMRLPSAPADPLGNLPVSHPAAPAAPQVDLNALLATQQHKSPLAEHAPWLTHGFAGIFAILAVSLIVLLAVQTTKQEGLSGTIGGRVDSPYGRRLGGDQQLARVTSYVALGLAFTGMLLAFSGI
jgi:preprotein translocase subunit SecG